MHALQYSSGCLHPLCLMQSPDRADVAGLCAGQRLHSPRFSTPLLKALLRQAFVYGLHHSSKYWDAPDAYRPERWLAPAPSENGRQPALTGLGLIATLAGVDFRSFTYVCVPLAPCSVSTSPVLYMHLLSGKVTSSHTQGRWAVKHPQAPMAKQA